ncbi:hypothetical protein ACP4OV_022581 [Aristida adscensionis]
MRHIRLPPLTPANEARYGGCSRSLRPVRGVAWRDGVLRLIEMEFGLDDDDTNSLNCHRSDRWRATMYKTTIDGESWEACGAVDSADLLPDDDSRASELDMNKVECFAPELDVHRDGVVYMMAKVNGRGSDGLILAFDAGNRLEKLVLFSAETVNLEHNYLQAEFTKYRDMAAAGARVL